MWLMSKGSTGCVRVNVVEARGGSVVFRSHKMSLPVEVMVHGLMGRGGTLHTRSPLINSVAGAVA